MTNNNERMLVAKQKYEGDIFKTASGGDVEVVEYITSKKILVKFLETGNTVETSTGNLVKGLVKDIMHQNVQSVGYLGVGKYKCRVRGRSGGKDGFRAGCRTLEYSFWETMMYRVYGNTKKEVQRIYGDVTVCEEWHNFQNFAEWCQHQKCFEVGAHLDKDLLVVGNKVYSPETSCFIPKHLNVAITGKKHTNTTGFTGVFDEDTGFSASITINSVAVRLGTFESKEKAFSVYKSVKEAYIKALAEVYKDKISEAAYNALLTWEAT
jgi:hypothetical protein